MTLLHSKLNTRVSLCWWSKS